MEEKETFMIIIMVVALMWLTTVLFFIERERSYRATQAILDKQDRRLNKPDSDLDEDIRNLRDYWHQHRQQQLSESRNINNLIDANFKIVTDNFKAIDERFNEVRAKSDRMNQNLKLIMET